MIVLFYLRIEALVYKRGQRTISASSIHAVERLARKISEDFAILVGPYSIVLVFPVRWLSARLA